MFFLKIKPFFRGYEVTGLRRLQGYEIAKSSIYLATTALGQCGLVSTTLSLFMYAFRRTYSVALMKPKVLFLTLYKQSNSCFDETQSLIFDLIQTVLFYASHSYRVAHKISSHSWFCLSLNKRIDQFV